MQTDRNKYRLVCAQCSLPSSLLTNNLAKFDIKHRHISSLTHANVIPKGNETCPTNSCQNSISNGYAMDFETDLMDRTQYQTSSETNLNLLSLGFMCCFFSCILSCLSQCKHKWSRPQINMMIELLSWTQVRPYLWQRVSS